jgi:hypothetical protein
MKMKTVVAVHTAMPMVETTKELRNCPFKHYKK